jgi:hypothetical protein
MSTEYIGQRPPHTSLPNWLRGKATPLELATLWALQSHYPNIHPSLSLLAKEACISRRSVCTVLTGMERKGWLVRDQAFDDSGRKTSNRYRLTIWDLRWFSIYGAGDALVQEVHHRTSAGAAPSLVQEVHIPSAGGAHKEDQSKKNNLSKTLEPPLPPSGGNAGEGQGELITVEALPVALPVDAAVSKSPESAKVSEPPPQTMALTKPARKPRFQPTADDIPADLLPVQHELLAFWPTRSGQMTPEAWVRMLGQARQIQQDQRGGTEILRGQLEDGVAASIDGKRWQSLKFKNWELYGPKAGAPAMRLGNRRKTPEEHAADSIAFIEARDARRAAAASAPGQTVLCEVLA